METTDPTKFPGPDSRRLGNGFVPENFRQRYESWDSAILFAQGLSKEITFITEYTYRWGKAHCIAGRHFNKTEFEQKHNMFLYVVKQLNENLQNWRPAVQWYFPSDECPLVIGIRPFKMIL